MKRFVLIISTAAVMASCNTRVPSDIGNTQLSSPAVLALIKDTAGLAAFQEFQQWKIRNESASTIQSKKPGIIYSPARKSSGSGAVNSGSHPENSGVESTQPASEYPEKKVQKKGWSKAAKGTAIGAGSGAVIGAVINKRNRAVGAVIGSVVGGGVGYGIGRSMDKKDGRY